LDKGSKNKAVPKDWLQTQKASKFRGKQIDPVENSWRFGSPPDRRPHGFNQQTTMRDVLASVNSVEHRQFGSLSCARKKQSSAERYMNRT
jgi:hypothetical protein